MCLGDILVRTLDLNYMLTRPVLYLYFYLYLQEDGVSFSAEAVVSFGPMHNSMITERLN